MTQTTGLAVGMEIDGYEIVEGSLDNHSPAVLGVALPADAFIDGADDDRYPAPAGYEWGEGLVVDGINFVELVELRAITIHYRDDQVGDMLEEFGSLADAERDSTANWLLSLEEQGPSWYELHGCGYPDSDCTAAQSEIQDLTRCSDETHDGDDGCDNVEGIRGGITCLYVGVWQHADVPECDCWQRDGAPDECSRGYCSHADSRDRAHVWSERNDVRGGHGLDTSWSATCKVCGIERTSANLQVPGQAEQTVRYTYVSYHRDGELVS